MSMPNRSSGLMPLSFLAALVLAASGCDPKNDPAAPTTDGAPPADAAKDGGPGDAAADAAPPSECVAGCVQEDMAAFTLESCRTQCTSKSARLGSDPVRCGDLCNRARDRRSRLATLKCKTRCETDADRDGVPDAIDRCPETPPGSPTTWFGCPDTDRDGVPDAEDDCPQQGGQPPGHVTVGGCPLDVEACDEGHCHPDAPKCTTEAECDRISEIPMPLVVPEAVRHDAIRAALSLRGHDITCPDDPHPPAQPDLTSPAGTVTPLQVGSVAVTLSGGEVTAGPETTVALAWSPVTDSCMPVRYSLYVEYYHCHKVKNLIDQPTYFNRGWCKWMPYLYETLDATTYSLKLPFGKLLYDIHRPFATDLGWNPPANGEFTIRYAPFWIRVRLIAHDGNGNTSAFGIHTDHRYLVLYADKSVSAAALTEIPVAP